MTGTKLASHYLPSKWKLLQSGYVLHVQCQRATLDRACSKLSFVIICYFIFNAKGLKVGSFPKVFSFNEEHCPIGYLRAQAPY